MAQRHWSTGHPKGQPIFYVCIHGGYSPSPVCWFWTPSSQLASTNRCSLDGPGRPSAHNSCVTMWLNTMLSHYKATLTVTSERNKLFNSFIKNPHLFKHNIHRRTVWLYHITWGLPAAVMAFYWMFPCHHAYILYNLSPTAANTRESFFQPVMLTSDTFWSGSISNE